MRLPLPPALLRPRRGAAARAVAAALLLAAAGCSRVADTGKSTAALPSDSKSTAPDTTQAASASAAAHAPGIAWLHVVGEADVDRAFNQARAQNKPLFLYWGAVWCPPCNQVKATLFNRSDFIERSRAFVPVYLDGDSAGAQKLGARYKVRGYPTMILFKPDGAEITRLPGEVNPQRYLQVLTLGINAVRPVKDLLREALERNGRARLTAEDWRLLAYYAWDTDEQQLVPKAELAGKLAQLARACPPEQRDASQRLLLKSLAAAADAAPAAGGAPADKQTLARVDAILVDPQLARENNDILVGWPTELINRLAPVGSAARAPLAQHWAAALDRLSRDTTLSRGDRIDALGARIEVAKLLAGTAPLDPELLRQVRDIVARIDLDTTNPYERQAVIPSAGHVLADAGLLHDSDALLTAELPRAIAPYYHMLVLASNDRKRGDKAGALEWYEKAYGQSRGPATRLQWGATYVSALVELAPQDARQIDHVVSQIIAELPPQADTFYERNQRALQRIGRVLDQWNAKGAHTALVQQLHGKLGLVCRKLPPGDAARAQCDSAFDAPPASART